MKAKRISIGLVAVIGSAVIFITSCSPPKPVTKVTFLEKIVVDNEDTTDGIPKFKGEPHGGTYYSHTDSLNTYGSGTRFMIADSLVQKDIKVKINMWARQGAVGGENQFAVALQSGDSVLNWDAIKIEKHIGEPNKWINIKDSVIFPYYLINRKGLSIKMFSFNPKGKPYFDTDDVEILLEKSEQVTLD